MRRYLLTAAAVLALSSVPALAQSQDDDMCPSGQVNTAPAGSPQKCAVDVTATTPAPEVVRDAGAVVKGAGEAVKDAGEAVADTVAGAVKDLTR